MYRPPGSSSSASRPYSRIDQPAGTGTRVANKHGYQPQLPRKFGKIPRNDFHFELDLERKMLAEGQRENIPSKPAESVPSVQISNSITSRSATKEKPSEKSIPENCEGKRRIPFFEGSNLEFDLEDLLSSSAEMLGKGTFGTIYMAVLEVSTTVVVKRLKGVSTRQRDFEQYMETVGSIRHENVAAPRAYYCSEYEKLLLYDYFDSGSISTLLHERYVTPLAWDTRLRITICGARGLAHIHTQNGGKLVHGNIKASNIFLNSQQHVCISEVGLATILTPLTPPVRRSAGYTAPEASDLHRATQASDVYSFGVFLLELLTGKSPLEYGMNLVEQVKLVVKENWTSEVFDEGLLRYPDAEQEMVQMLQLGITCTSRVPDKRPRMVDVVSVLEKIQEERFKGSTPS